MNKPTTFRGTVGRLESGYSGVIKYFGFKILTRSVTLLRF